MPPVNRPLQQSADDMMQAFLFPSEGMCLNLLFREDAADLC